MGASRLQAVNGCLICDDGPVGQLTAGVFVVLTSNAPSLGRWLRLGWSFRARLWSALGVEDDGY